MSGTATPEREEQLLDIGKQCSDPTCLLVDFLPFKCQHCAQPFCGEHFLPTTHHCSKYDAAKHDRVAPSCPLCSAPVAIPPGQDPNIRMERHINTECSVMTGRSSKAKSTPHCARPKCGKVLFSPIRCDSCKHQFCPEHRFPKDHSCSATKGSVSSQQGGVKAWTNVQHQTSAASAAAMAAIKRAAASSTAPARTTPRTQTQAKSQPPPSDTKSTSSSSRSNPFSATDRRAKAERESRRKAIEARAQKGIPPTEAEKAFLAEEKRDGKDECVVA
ncbi:hypothetical protein GSI_15159 [Ganoderma sinense ZZ0214-1]|uniref:AN1-type domain-containing protein n=1 Tax=Ganoderma sinense ZZ0214-1 TaxID=1077348 RepID=A0A2G8RLT4_9APHY|nr:hypothetical protein GSI_15159 [Ganoderma sinense ZZ0214-1]